MQSRKQHSAELRERAVAMVFELRAESGSSRGTLASVGQKLGVNPETLRNWVEKAEIDSGQRPGTTSAPGQPTITASSLLAAAQVSRSIEYSSGTGSAGSPHMISR